MAYVRSMAEADVLCTAVGNMNAMVRKLEGYQDRVASEDVGGVACRFRGNDGVAIETLTDNDGGIQIKPHILGRSQPGAFMVPCCEIDKKESRGQRLLTESLMDRGMLRQFVRSRVRKHPRTGYHNPC